MTTYAPDRQASRRRSRRRERCCSRSLAAAAAATAPTAITGPVNAVGATTATLTGTVNPNGTATTWIFEYGKTTTYGTQTAVDERRVRDGEHRRLVEPDRPHAPARPTTTASSRRAPPGRRRAPTGSSPPPPPRPPSPARRAASPRRSATLNGTVNANGRPTTYYFEYGKTTSYGTKTAVQSGGSGTSPVAVSASITGLQTGQTYHFRLVATSDAGTSAGRRHDVRRSAPRPDRDDEGGELDHLDEREAERDRQPERAGDDLVLRLRQRRRATARRRRSRASARARTRRTSPPPSTASRAGTLPLPARRHERRRARATAPT